MESALKYRGFACLNFHDDCLEYNAKAYMLLEHNFPRMMWRTSSRWYVWLNICVWIGFATKDRNKIRANLVTCQTNTLPCW
jgi:hypothetical protein